MEEHSSSWGGFLIVAFIVGLIIFLVQPDKYEGQTAEEWFNSYDAENAKYEALKSCVEEYAYSDDYSYLKEIANSCL